jgi:drug/metabolite transporter (DMT)-like permease
MSYRRAVLFIVLSAIGFGSMGLFASAAYASGTTPSTLLALRFILACAFLLPLIWLKGWKLPRGKSLAAYIFMGLLYTAQSQSYFNALLYASSGLVALLVYVYPALVTLLALLLGWEKPERRLFVLLAVASCGIVITLGGEHQGSAAGVVLGLMAALIYSVYILLGRRLSLSADDTHPLASSVVILATAAVGNSLLAIWDGISLPGSLSAYFAIGMIAVFSTAMAISFFLIGVKRVGASQASILSSFEPVVTLVIGVVALNERVSMSQLFGGFLVLLSVLFLALRTPPKSPYAETQQANKLHSIEVA